MEEINKDNIWSLYAPLFASITPRMSRELLSYGASNVFGNVLDAGCGVGKAIPYISRNPNVNSLVCIDSNKEMLTQAEKLVLSIDSKIPINILEGDIEQDFPQSNTSYDSILSLNVLYTLKKPEEFLERSYAKLSTGGVLVLSSPNKNMDMGYLEKIVDDEFANDDNYEDFKRCNHYLVSLGGFSPALYDSEEIEEILSKIGFDIVSSSNDHYHGHLFSIIGRKN